MKVGIFEYNWGKLLGGSHMYIGAAAEALSRENDVTILHQYDELSNEYIADFLDLDLSRVRFLRIPQIDPGHQALRSLNPVVAHRRRVNECRELTEPYDLFVNNCSFRIPFFNHGRRGVLIVDFPFRDFDWWHDFGRPQRHLTWPSGVAQKLYRRHLWRRRFASYQSILTYSEYCRDWLKRRWGVDAEVVYPPARVGAAPAAKEKVILAVVRFVPDKKADVLVEAFRTLCDRGMAGWKFVLAGGGNSDQVRNATNPYLESLRQRAQGYPIEIRVDVSGPEINRLFGAAAIFWHAKGYEIDLETQPEEMEHFGIVTVEAMSAGCVPVVFNGGGQPEIVRQGVDGFLWSGVEELVDHTWSLTHSDADLETTARKAIARAEMFSKSRFIERFLDTVSRLSGPERDCENSLDPERAPDPVVQGLRR